MSEVVPVASLLCAGGYIGVGDAVRLSRCDAALRAALADDGLLWRAASQAARWKTPARSLDEYVARRGSRRCCRECGVLRATPLIAANGDVVFACLACRQASGGFSEVVSRLQIKEGIEDRARRGLWATKYAAVLRRLHCCKRTRTGGFLYWRAHVDGAIAGGPRVDA